MPEKILIIGRNSTIAKEFIKKINNTKIIAPPKSLWNMKNTDLSKKKINIIKNVDKILLLQSVITSKIFLNRKQSEIINQININFLSVKKFVNWH